MLRCMMRVVVLILLGFWAVTPGMSMPIPIANASFEAPLVDPNGFGALPVVDGWTELDLDVLGSTNTGVFANTAADSPDHVANADGNQLAFLGSELDNGLQQTLSTTYKVGCDYRLTVGVGVSMRFPPSVAEPVDTVELVLYYLNETDVVVDIASATVEATGLSTTQLEDFSLYLPTVGSDDAWAGKSIGVAIRGASGPWTTSGWKNLCPYRSRLRMLLLKRRLWIRTALERCLWWTGGQSWTSICWVAPIRAYSPIRRRIARIMWPMPTAINWRFSGPSLAMVFNRNCRTRTKWAAIIA